MSLIVHAERIVGSNLLNECEVFRIDDGIILVSIAFKHVHFGYGDNAKPKQVELEASQKGHVGLDSEAKSVEWVHKSNQLVVSIVNYVKLVRCILVPRPPFFKQFLSHRILRSSLAADN